MEALKKRRKILFLSQKEIYVSNEYLALKTHKQYSDCMVIFTSSSYLLNFFKKSFNWRIIALQCCVGFYCIAMQISHNYICTLSLLSPYHPSRLSQNTRLYSLCYIEAPHQLPVLHMQYIYVSATVCDFLMCMSSYNFFLEQQYLKQLCCVLNFYG